MTTIKTHNVFYYDIESRLEQYYKCKVERPEKYDERTGELIQSRMTVHKTQSFHTLDEVNDFKCTLSEQEKSGFPSCGVKVINLPWFA